jgi:DNA-binding transcriptional ArsR family regulator
VNKVFKALSDPTRRQVLQLLRERHMSAGELSDHFPVSKPTMSAHFSVLQEADLVEAEKLGRSIVYRLKMSVLEEALLGFAQTFGWEMKTPETAKKAPRPVRPVRGESCLHSHRHPRSGTWRR